MRFRTVLVSAIVSCAIALLALRVPLHAMGIVNPGGWVPGSAIGSGVGAVYINTAPQDTNQGSFALGSFSGAALMSSLVSPGTADIAIGPGAMHGITTGYDDVAIGRLACQGTTTGYGDVCVGEGTNAGNTGYGETAVGGSAMSSDQSGNTNTGVGGYSQYSLTTGVSNTGVGWGTLYSNLAGEQNTAIGADALYHAVLTSGTGKNISIGWASGYNLTTGTANILIGSGTSAHPTTTGANNILIGNANTNATATGSWQLDIGDTIYGSLNGSGSGSVTLAAATSVPSLNINSSGVMSHTPEMVLQFGDNEPTDPAAARLIGAAVIPAAITLEAGEYSWNGFTGCTTYPTYELYDVTTSTSLSSQTVTGTAENASVTPSTTAIAASDDLEFLVESSGVGCSQAAQLATIHLNQVYQMQ